MNKSVAMLLVLVFLITSCLAASMPVNAGYRTIIVPDYYATIQNAVNAANKGDTIFVRKGTYEGSKNQTLMISKSLSLMGENANNTILNLHPAWVTTATFPDTRSSGYANPIKIEANNVRIAGFTITSDGGDISVTGNRTQIIGNILNTGLNLWGSNQILAKNTITARINVLGSYCNIFENNVTNTTVHVGVGSYNCLSANNVVGGGLDSGGGGSTNLIYGNTVKNGSGIWACYGDIVANNTVINSDKGIAVMWGFNNIIYGNFIMNNHGPGLTKGEGLNNIFYANHVANNSVGISIGTSGLSHSGETTFYHNNFINNIQQTQIVNLDHSDYWDNGKEGNYWSDYTGSDGDNDGIGDAPYVMFGDSYHENYPYVIYGDNYTDCYPLMGPFDISSVTIKLPNWAADQLATRPSLDTTPPIVSILSPENKTFLTGNLSLTLTVSEPTSWIGYSLDGLEKITIEGNATLAGLTEGAHKLTIYAMDGAGNIGASETVHFSIEPPFPTTLVITSVASVAVIGLALLVYFKKHKP